MWVFHSFDSFLGCIQLKKIFSDINNLLTHFLGLDKFLYELIVLLWLYIVMEEVLFLISIKRVLMSSLNDLYMFLQYPV